MYLYVCTLLNALVGDTIITKYKGANQFSRREKNLFVYLNHPVMWYLTVNWGIFLICEAFTSKAGTVVNYNYPYIAPKTKINTFVFPSPILSFR